MELEWVIAVFLVTAFVPIALGSLFVFGADFAIRAITKPRKEK